MKTSSEKTPNCYDCKWRGEVPGSYHSCCNHPKAEAAAQDTRMLQLFSMLGGIAAPPSPSAAALNVKGDPHGIQNGWFSWPWNFDPTWLQSCDGFEQAG